jgi:hypothetical protein
LKYLWHFIYKKLKQITFQADKIEETGNAIITWQFDLLTEDLTARWQMSTVIRMCLAQLDQQDTSGGNLKG